MLFRSGCWANSSVVGPPRVRGRNLGAVVLHGDAAQRVVLALRVAHPVVGHLDAGQRRVPVEHDPEEIWRCVAEVVPLALLVR